MVEIGDSKEDDVSHIRADLGPRQMGRGATLLTLSP